MRMRPIQKVEEVRPHFFPLVGGENLVDPALSIKPGELLYSQNYEHAPLRGYRRIDGYERFDGRPKPSEASYWVLNFDAGSTEIGVGDTVDGGTSGASGEALIVTVTSGTWAGGDAAGYLILFNVTGTYQDNENLEVSASAYAVANGSAIENGAGNDTDDDTWSQATIEAVRADIQAVPGSGVIRGVWMYNGVAYAFRDNAGGTACVMHKSSSSGWTEVDLGSELAFTSGGTTEIVEGNTITGATSGATATVDRVVVQSGTWSGGDAAGYFIISGQTGTFQAENIDVGAAANDATISGDSSAITLSPGGRYEFVNHNFYGSAQEVRMYGCDGVNYAFEFDGTVFTPIRTGMATDTPIHITEHKKHLFLAFPKGSVQHSSIGVPLEWSPVTGASEIGTGDEVTGFEVVPGDVLAIFNRNQTYLLYGTSSADWNLKTLSDEAGAVEWSVQRMGRPIYLDDRGLTDLTAVQKYGDFKDNAFSRKIQPIIDSKKGLVTASVRVRSKDQYRLFFSDNTGIIAKFENNKLLGFTRIDYGMAVRCACSVEDSSGNEVLLFGSDDGYVYQMDAGTSFDGSAVEAYVRLAFDHIKSPNVIKDFKQVTLELDAPKGAALAFTPEFSYSSTDIPAPSTEDLNVTSGGGIWGIATWGEFIWGDQVVGTADAYLDGSGSSISLLVRSNATYETPHTLQGVTMKYSMRGYQR